MSKWTDKAVIYHIYPIGFCGAPKINDDGETVSRINKVTDWIEHLNNININAVYFGPVFESSAHGYDISDYMRIDRRLGTNEDFENISRQLHEKGIRVIVDGVFNHVGRNFWAFKDVREKGQNSKYCSWFKNLNFGGNSPMGDNFWYEGWEGHFNLVTLNLHNPEVKEHIFSAVKMWIEKFDIDGLRLDVAYCLEPQFIKDLRRFCTQLKPDFWIMGEVIHGDYSRFANSEMLESVTNYECYKGIYSSHNDKNYFEIAHSLTRQFGNGGNGGIYHGIKTYNFVDNHDVNRLASSLKNQKHIFNAYTILFTMPGCPSIYYGSEWGVKGEKIKGDDSPLRPCINIDDMSDNALTVHIAKLAKIRRELPVFENGAYHQMTLENKKYSYKRADGDKEVYVLLNIEDGDTWFNFRANSDKLVDLLTGEIFKIDGDANICVKSCTSRILTRFCDCGDLLNLSDEINIKDVEMTMTEEIKTEEQTAEVIAGPEINDEPQEFDYEQLLAEFGEALKKARCNKGFSIGQLADMTDITARDIIDMEKGKIYNWEDVFLYLYIIKCKINIE